MQGFNEVSLNMVGVSPQGIAYNQVAPDARINWNAIHGNLELLQLSLKSSCVKYYSDWIDEAEPQPYINGCAARAQR
ncbi:hypothetical protein [Nostoc sp.]|uniref:hypothetical protein n=1 Tax=Nostoc sp. TaxID=1180 RepID=UPI002FFB7549